MRTPTGIPGSSVALPGTVRYFCPQSSIALLPSYQGLSHLLEVASLVTVTLSSQCSGFSGIVYVLPPSGAAPKCLLLVA